MIDLIKTLNLPVIVVARSGLGTINHTCLTLQSLRNQAIEVFGVVINGEPNFENRQAIEHFGKVQVLAEMPKFEKLESEMLISWTKENLLCRL